MNDEITYTPVQLSINEPQFEHRAALLERLMEKPIPAKFAESWLENVCLDFPLRDFSYRCDPERDIRPELKRLLALWLTSADKRRRWRPEAIAICERLIAD